MRKIYTKTVFNEAREFCFMGLCCNCYCVNFGVAETDRTATFKVSAWIFLCNLIDTLLQFLLLGCIVKYLFGVRTQVLCVNITNHCLECHCNREEASGGCKNP